MSYFQWATKQVRKLDGLDMSLTKLSVLAFALMAAKLWPVLLSLEWYWYAILFIVFAIRPLYRIFK